MEDGEKKYIRALRDDDSMKRPWMGPCALKKVLGSNSMACHVGGFFFGCASEYLCIKEVFWKVHIITMRIQ